MYVFNSVEAKSFSLSLMEKVVRRQLFKVASQGLCEWDPFRESERERERGTKANKKNEMEMEKRKNNNKNKEKKNAMRYATK